MKDNQVKLRQNHGKGVLRTLFGNNLPLKQIESPFNYLNGESFHHRRSKKSSPFHDEFSPPR